MDQLQSVARQLGKLEAVDPARGRAWFASGIELAREEWADDVPRPRAWWEAVRDPERAAELSRAGLLQPDGPEDFGIWPREDALGWVLVEAETTWICSPRAFALLTVSTSSREASRALERFIARALARLAPDTWASAEEVQAMASRRFSKVREARPDGIQVGRTRWAAVGPWLDRLLLRAVPPTGRKPRGRRATISPLRPLGGPATMTPVDEDADKGGQP